MSKGKVTKFRGTKFLIQTGTSVTPETVKSITAANPGIIEITETVLVKGDVASIEGISGFEGEYVVKAVSGDMVTVVADWSDMEDVAAPTGVTAAKVEFSTNFCELTGFDDSGASVDWEENTTICTEGFKDFESGLVDAGTLQMNFNAAPSEIIQEKLAEYVYSGEKFWIKLLLTNNQGSMLYYGGIQTGPGISGQAGTPNLTSGATIKLSGAKYHIKAV